MTADEIRLRDALAGMALAGRLRHAHGPNCVLEREGQPCPLGELPDVIYARCYQDADEMLAARAQPASDPPAVEGADRAVIPDTLVVRAGPLT